MSLRKIRYERILLVVILSSFSLLMFWSDVSWMVDLHGYKQTERKTNSVYVINILVPFLQELSQDFRENTFAF